MSNRQIREMPPPSPSPSPPTHIRQTIKEIATNLEKTVCRPILCPKSKHKGKVGHLLEDILGIPRSSECLDCQDGEIKVFPLKALKNGQLVPKETVAITMLNEESLRNEEFTQSKCYTKMKCMLMIPYIRTGDSVTFLKPTLIKLTGEILDKITEDYNVIRSDFIAMNKLQSRTGKYLQNRTKGAGGSAPKTRAYYLRPAFMKEFCQLELPAPLAE